MGVGYIPLSGALDHPSRGEGSMVPEVAECLVDLGIYSQPLRVYVLPIAEPRVPLEEAARVHFILGLPPTGAQEEYELRTAF
jgi:hypothetical protein